MAETDEGNGSNGSNTPPSGLDDSAKRPAKTQNNLLSLAQLIGAPIHALVDAEAQAAMATSNFIRTVGFQSTPEGDGNELGELKMAKFVHSRIMPDGTEEHQEVSIPLLTLLPIPALQIRDAQLDYTVKVVQTEVGAQHSQQIFNELNIEKNGLSMPATIRASFAREQRETGKNTTDMVLKIKVNIEQSDMPSGLEKLLNIANEAVNYKRVTPLAPPIEKNA